MANSSSHSKSPIRIFASKVNKRKMYFLHDFSARTSTHLIGKMEDYPGSEQHDTFSYDFGYLNAEYSGIILLQLQLSVTNFQASKFNQL